jgi:hypothetical protein
MSDKNFYLMKMVQFRFARTLLKQKILNFIFKNGCYCAKAKNYIDEITNHTWKLRTFKNHKSLIVPYFFVVGSKVNDFHETITSEGWQRYDELIYNQVLMHYVHLNYENFPEVPAFFRKVFKSKVSFLDGE